MARNAICTMRMDEQFKFAESARFFRALGDETRLKIAALVMAVEGDGLCVTHLQTILNLPQPAVSRHLGVLRNAGVLTSWRKHSRVYYVVATHDDDPRRRAVAALVGSFLGKKSLVTQVKSAFSQVGR